MSTMDLEARHTAAAALLAGPALGSVACRAASPEYTIGLFEMIPRKVAQLPAGRPLVSALNLGAEEPRAAGARLPCRLLGRNCGWHDRFDSAAFTGGVHTNAASRQRICLHPRVLSAGSDFTWRSAGQPTRALATINARSPRASIELAASPTGHASVSVDVHVRVPELIDAVMPSWPWRWCENGVVSDVKAGENNGKYFVDDHVVCAWRPGSAVPARASCTRGRTAAAQRAGILGIGPWAEDNTSGDVLREFTLALCGN